MFRQKNLNNSNISKIKRQDFAKNPVFCWFLGANFGKNVDFSLFFAKIYKIMEKFFKNY
jgi:hypothetical protein